MQKIPITTRDYAEKWALANAPASCTGAALAQYTRDVTREFATADIELGGEIVEMCAAYIHEIKGQIYGMFSCGRDRWLCQWNDNSEKFTVLGKLHGMFEPADQNDDQVPVFDAYSQGETEAEFTVGQTIYLENRKRPIRLVDPHNKLAVWKVFPNGRCGWQIKPD